MIDRRQFLGAATAGAALQGAPSARKPNIVFILLDDLGYGDVGCYGQTKIQTPNIDRLATQGTRFTDCYAGGAVCAPSRSVLMTGLHTGHTPVRANAGTVPILPQDVTIAELLKNAGYATGAFGKWSLGDAGSTGAATRKGFDEFFGYLHQTHAHDYYPEYLRDGEKKFLLPGNAGGKHGQYSADLIQERALHFIQSNKDQPFFLYSCSTLPHGDFDPPNDKPYTDRDWPQPEKNYAAMVTRADKHVGEILTSLKSLKLEDDTVVIFASDNGGTGGEGRDVHFFNSTGPFRGQKGTLYEGGVRVPAIVRWNERVAKGVTSHFPWAFCDFFPTALEIAGLAARSGLDGISIVPTLLGKKQDRPPLYWEQHGYNRKTEQLTGMIQAARLDQWKAVRRSPQAPLEIYDLSTDLGEKKNLASAKPEIASKMDAILRSQHGEPRPHNTGTWEYTDKEATKKKKKKA